MPEVRGQRSEVRVLKIRKKTEGGKPKGGILSTEARAECASGGSTTGAGTDQSGGKRAALQTLARVLVHPRHSRKPWSKQNPSLQSLLINGLVVERPLS
jgi:hypothetical protein